MKERKSSIKATNLYFTEYYSLYGRDRQGMPTAYVSVSILFVHSDQNQCAGFSVGSSNQNSPTCSFPLKTYNRQLFVGFLASGGSWYLRTTPVTSGVPAFAALSEDTLTVLLSAARRPEFLKLGLGGDFARSGER